MAGKALDASGPGVEIATGAVQPASAAAGSSATVEQASATAAAARDRGSTHATYTSAEAANEPVLHALIKRERSARIAGALSPVAQRPRASRPERASRTDARPGSAPR